MKKMSQHKSKESKIATSLNDDLGLKQNFVAKQRFAFSNKVESSSYKFYSGTPNADKSVYTFRLEYKFCIYQ